MVLLLMKLDQLDQEIQDALCATSSMDSSPTLHHPQFWVPACMFSQLILVIFNYVSSTIKTFYHSFGYEKKTSLIPFFHFSNTELLKT